MGNNKHVSFLLGAGFSAPMGYPIGNDMNHKFLEFGNYFVDPINGEITGTPIENFTNNHYLKALTFCKKAILCYFKHNDCFDYEQFYEIIKSNLHNCDQPIECNRIVNQIVTQEERSRLFTDIEVIYNRLVAFFLKDSKNRQWYEGDEFLNDDDIRSYQQFIQLLNLMSENSIVNVHTLNHDMLLEALGRTTLLSRIISDGFSPLNSNYASVRETDGRKDTVVLEEYTGEYQSNIRLYKLHGSLNYWRFCKTEDNGAIPEQILKIKKDTSPVDLFKIDPVKKTRVDWPFEYYPIFLTGTTSKEQKYKSFFYDKLIQLFEDNLSKSDLLVVIGYGFKDEGINKIIENCFDYTNKQVVVIDPSVNSNVTISSIAKKWNAARVEKNVAEIEFGDILQGV